MSRYLIVTADEFDALHADSLPNWRRDGAWLRAELIAPGFTAAADLARGIAVIADELDHHPDIDIRYPGRVLVSTTTHDTGGLTMHDIRLAHLVSALHNPT